MKKWIMFFLTALVLSPVIKAQHCPFDGSAAVFIRVLNSKGEPLARSTTRFFLMETDTLKADSCTYANGALKIPFGSIDSALVKKYPNTWEYRARIYLKETPLLEAGYQVVVLNQAQASCMINRNNQFHYIKRKFEIRWEGADHKTAVITVPADKIYSLCTSAGAWTRITAIEMVMQD